MRSPSTRRTPLAVTAAALVLAAPAAWAGSTVVSANPHRLTCSAANPPQLAIVQDAGVHAVSYHVDDDLDCEFTTALNFNSQNKPKILSDDIKSSPPAQVKPRIDQVANAGEHFEHWAGVLDAKLVKGIPINSDADTDADSEDIMQKLGTRASWLSSNGTLTRSGTELYWNGQQVTLMGFSLAPIMATKNVNLTGYLDVLASYGVNLLRVDGISQWAALEIGRPGGGVDPTDGLNPFAVSVAGSAGATLTTKWNLNAFNTEYFNRAKELVQLAAERGMVVQYSIFDRHGLRNFGPDEPDFYGRWAGSPYNPSNNTSGIPLAAGTSKKAPPGFTGTDGTAIGGVNRAYVEKLVKEIGAYGNVIFEIMNEPLESDNDWTNTPDWHSWVAQVTNTALATPLVSMPIPKAQTAVSGSSVAFHVMTSGAISSWQWQQSAGGPFTNLMDGPTVQGSTTPTLRLLSVSGSATYRCLMTGGLNSGPATLTVVGGGQVAKDGFTAADGTAVLGRTTESGAKTWGADNAQINGGKVRSQGSGNTRLLGSVAVNTAGFATAAVQAEVKQIATGSAGVGFRPSATGQFELTNGSVWVDMSRGGVVALKKRAGGVTTTLRTVDLNPLGFVLNNTVHLRLVYKVATQRADVYVNHVKRMHNVALAFTPTVTQAGFQARRGMATDPYNFGDGEIDNFEVVLAP